MDHWGDPWADDAEKPRTKHEVTSPLPTAAPAPVLLQGFLDDAQWGSHDDEGFGAWATSPRKQDTVPEAVQETRALDTSDGSFDTTEKPLGNSDWKIEKNDDHLEENNNWTWSEDRLGSPKEPENIVSESSDSATTIQPDEAPDRESIHSVDAAQRDDDLSTRPSTSPSETSHNEAPSESPRTSFEEERAAGKAVVNDDIQKAGDEANDEAKVEESGPKTTTKESADDDFGDFEEDVLENDEFETQETQKAQEVHKSQEKISEPPDPPRHRLDNKIAPAQDAETDQKPPYVSSISLGGFAVDSELMSQLFPPSKDVEQLDDAPDDPIFSTSARKAWYRLTRKQTLREFNNGNDDDNYIRVTWATSHIRSDVNKIVGRWANEDRMSGKGPGARASFYWDTPAPSHSRAPSTHIRKPSSTSVSSPLRPAKPNVPPLSTNAPAAFNWSSPTSSANPWNQPSPSVKSNPSPFAPKHPAVRAIPRPDGRAASVDLTPRTIAETLHKRTSTAFDLPKPSAPLVPFPASNLANSPVASSPLANSSVANSSLTSSPIANSPLANLPIIGPPPSANSSVANSPLANLPFANSSLANSPLPHSPFANSPLANPPTTNDPWANVSSISANPPPSEDPTPDDDDDWGEMVQSPAVSNPTPIEPMETFSDPLTRNNTLSTPSTTPKSIKTSPIQNLPSGSKNASPIVRLKSVISPTSARFKPNSYIPASAEEGPIGPGLLKPANKSPESTPGEKTQSRPVSILTEEVDVKSQAVVPQGDNSEDFSAWETVSPEAVSDPQKDDFAAFESSIPTQEPLQNPVKSPILSPPSTTPETAQPPPSESWADADFSIFESATPAQSQPGLQIQPKYDPSDPFSIFKTTTPLSSVPSTPFTRPPPRPVTPPPIQPLTGATNSAQKRKADEDELIKSIVRGLPDLSYMLRV